VETTLKEGATSDAGALPDIRFAVASSLLPDHEPSALFFRQLD
jgi:hypothetical protein